VLITEHSIFHPNSAAQEGKKELKLLPGEKSNMAAIT
jgi:hypothetical protein